MTRWPYVFAGLFKGRLNLNYSASENKNSKHRALHILNPDPSMSGDYTCSVSTFKSEDSQTKKMVVLGKCRLISLSILDRFVRDGFIVSIILSKATWLETACRALQISKFYTSTSTKLIIQHGVHSSFRFTWVCFPEYEFIMSSKMILCNLHFYKQTIFQVTRYTLKRFYFNSRCKYKK